jgi:DNA invertase Pin-like site-specific DNA recombinase
MDCRKYITIAPERKRGQHLGREERGAIQQLKKQGYSLRAIAREINCSPSTVIMNCDAVLLRAKAIEAVRENTVQSAV